MGKNEALLNYITFPSPLKPWMLIYPNLRVHSIFLHQWCAYLLNRPMVNDKFCFQFAETTVVYDTTGVLEFVDSTPRLLDAGERPLVSPRSVEFCRLLLVHQAASFVYMLVLHRSVCLSCRRIVFDNFLQFIFLGCLFDWIERNSIWYCD